jgi:hypothetical protein
MGTPGPARPMPSPTASPMTRDARRQSYFEELAAAVNAGAAAQVL